MSKKDKIKEEIVLWRDLFKSVTYILIILVSSTIARIIKYGLKDKWSIIGIIFSIFFVLIFVLIWKTTYRHIKSLEEVD